MDDLHDNPGELPILTEVVRPEAVTLSAPRRAVARQRFEFLDADPRGYDPYNNAPPVPADGSRFA